MNYRSGLLLIYNILLFGYIFNLGFYTFHGVILILISITMLLFLVRNKLILTALSFDSLLKYSVLLSIILAIILDGGYYQQQNDLFVNQILLFVALIVFLVYFINTKNRLLLIFVKNKFVLLLITALIARLFILISSPSPKIDVFYVLKEGPLALWYNFANPYSIEFTKLYPKVTPDTFGYLPATILSVLPFDVFFSEPRLALLTAQFIFVLVVLKLAKKRQEAELFSLLAVYHPKSLFILEQSWVDMLFISLFGIYLVVNLKSNLNEYLKGLILGFLLLIKLSYLPLLVFLIRPGFLRLRNITGVVVTFLAIALPFILWSPSSFISDILLPYADPTRNAAPVNMSLNLNAFSIQNFGDPIPLVFRLVAITICGILILLWQKKNVSNMILSFTVFLTITYFFGDQAFINYYHAISLLLILALTVTEPYLNEKN